MYKLICYPLLVLPMNKYQSKKIHNRQKKEKERTSIFFPFALQTADNWPRSPIARNFFFFLLLLNIRNWPIQYHVDRIKSKKTVKSMIRQMKLGYVKVVVYHDVLFSIDQTYAFSFTAYNRIKIKTNEWSCWVIIICLLYIGNLIFYRYY